MTDQARVGSATKRLAWAIGATLPVAALTASGEPWKWGFVLTFVGTVHVGAVLLISIGAGYLLASRVRPQRSRG